MGKRFPLKAIRTLGEKTGEAEAEKNDCPQIEPTWEHEALSGTDPIICARYKSFLLEAPEKRCINQKRDSSKRIEQGKIR